MPIFHEKHVNQRIYVLGNENKNFVICFAFRSVCTLLLRESRLHLGNENKNFVICFAFRSVCTTFAEWKQNSGLSLASMRCERKVRAA